MDELKSLIAEKLHRLDVLELKSDINPFRSFASYIESAEHLENFYAQQMRYFAVIRDPKDKPGTTKVKIKSLNYSILNLSILDSVGV